MPSFRGRTTLKRLAALLLVVAPVLPAGSLGAAEPDNEQALQLDQNIQTLKDEAVQLSRDAQLVDEMVNYPPYLRVDVYVSVETAALLLQKLSVSVDGAEPVRYEYNENDAKALLKSKGLQHVGRFRAAKGIHRLHAEYTGNYADAQSGEAPITDAFDVVFDKGVSTTTLELIVGKANRGGKPILRLKEWREAP